MLVRSCLKSYMLGFSIIWTKNFQLFKQSLEKEEEPEIKLPTFTGLHQENFRKTSICFIDYTTTFDCVNHEKPWKAVREMGISDHLTCLLRNLHAGQETKVSTFYGACELNEPETMLRVLTTQWEGQEFVTGTKERETKIISKQAE